jgi:DNA-binding transcriptional regulator GbsR (MarR family)
MLDNHHPSPHLTPALSQFIENLARYFESYGIPRIGGRILGLLMIANEPLSAETIAAALKVSRASISTNLRFALNIGLAERVSFPGDRVTYYVFPDSGLEGTLAIETQGLGVMKKLIQQGLAALPREDEAYGRLEGLADWADFLIQVWEKALTEWRVKQHEKRRIQA